MPSTAPAFVTGVAALLVALLSLVGTWRTERGRRRGEREQAVRSDVQQRELERLKSELEVARAEASEARKADELMRTYLNPLARSTYDLQSRLWNMHRGFRGGGDPRYFRNNTLYVVAELLGWLEIVRQEVQFLDGGVRTDAVRTATVDLQDVLASTSGHRGHGDAFYLYRGHQRAIGELMIEPRAGHEWPGPARQCLGYAAFVTRLDAADFAQWFDRFAAGLDELGPVLPLRLLELQRAAVFLLGVLDPDASRCPGPRGEVDLLS